MSRSLVSYSAMVALLLLVAVRFVALETDPPFFYIGHGQSQLTDTYQSTLSARNAVVYGSWNPYGFHRWDVFKHSVVSGMAYLFFNVFGVSRVTANLASLTLQLIGFLFFLLGMMSLRDKWEVIVTALILLLNSTLFFYGRMPYLENGLIFFAGLLFFVQMRFSERLWGQLLTGFLVALAGLAGKLFGLLLAGPVLVVTVYQYRSKLLKPLFYIAVGFIVGALSYLYLFYGGDISLLRSYYAEQAVGMYGPPPGLQSINYFFLMLFTYGGESGLWEYIPFLFLLVVGSMLITLLKGEYVGPFKKENLPIVFCFGGLLLGILGLSPHYYRPMRYSLFLLLPATMICGYVLRSLSDKKLTLQLKVKSAEFVIVLIVIWYAIVQSVMIFKEPSLRFDSGKDVVWIAGGVALLIALILSYLLREKRVLSKSFFVAIPFAVIVVGMLVVQVSYIERGLFSPGAYFQAYNKLISQLIDENSVITGPYAPALSIDNRLGALIYMFGLSDVERELFDRTPITHIVTDGSNWREAKEHFPKLQNSTIVCQFVIKNRTIQLYRVPEDRVPLTDFEKGVNYYIERKPDSAFAHFNSFVHKYPENWIGYNYLALSLFAQMKFPETVKVLELMDRKFPENYMVLGACRGMYRQLSKVTKEKHFQQIADSFEERVLKLNPIAPIN